MSRASICVQHVSNTGTSPKILSIPMKISALHSFFLATCVHCPSLLCFCLSLLCFIVFFCSPSCHVCGSAYRWICNFCILSSWSNNKVPSAFLYFLHYVLYCSSAVTHAMFVVESPDSDEYAIPAVWTTSS